MEAQLTPKEWAIRLAQEMKSQASAAEFIRIAAKKAYREWPWVKPFFKLGEQAEARYPGHRPEDLRARNQLDRKLRTEFHALRKLICKAGETIANKAETIGLKTALKLSTLHALILRDSFGQAVKRAIPLIEATKTGGYENEEREAF